MLYGQIKTRSRAGKRSFNTLARWLGLGHERVSFQAESGRRQVTAATVILRPSLAGLPLCGSADDCEVVCKTLAQFVCRAGGITGILVSSATYIARTISLPFHENLGRLFADVGHLYAYRKLVAP